VNRLEWLRKVDWESLHWGNKELTRIGSPPIYKESVIYRPAEIPLIIESKNNACDKKVIARLPLSRRLG
jgi:hypothetical protein